MTRVRINRRPDQRYERGYGIGRGAAQRSPSTIASPRADDVRRGGGADQREGYRGLERGYRDGNTWQSSEKHVLV